MSEAFVVDSKDFTANPAPLGLFGFGLTTILLNFHNAGWFGLNTMILAMGLFYGGLAQLLAGLLEWKKNNTFGMTAFISYGAFWLSLVVLILLPPTGAVQKANPTAMATYLGVWGLFTAGLFVGTLRLTRALQVVFASLTILFFMLAIGEATEAGETFGHITGYEGIFCGASACYTGLAVLLNEVYGRTVLPVGAMARR